MVTEAELYERFREARRTLRAETVKVKNEEFLVKLDLDPWGREYLSLRGKLRHWASRRGGSSFRVRGRVT